MRAWVLGPVIYTPPAIPGWTTQIPHGLPGFQVDSEYILGGFQVDSRYILFEYKKPFELFEFLVF